MHPVQISARNWLVLLVLELVLCWFLFPADKEELLLIEPFLHVFGTVYVPSMLIAVIDIVFVAGGFELCDMCMIYFIWMIIYTLWHDTIICI